MNDEEFIEINQDIFEDLEYLERFYNKDYISLKQYYEIKSNIITKYIALGEHYKEEIKEGLVDDR